MRRRVVLWIVAVCLSSACGVIRLPPNPTPDGITEWWEVLPDDQRELWYNLDRLLNLFLDDLPGEEVPGMTISERLGRAAWMCNRDAIGFCQILDLYDKGHCDRAIHAPLPERLVCAK